MSTAERWRMPSGRIATIDLQQTPEAIEDARALLREFGEAVLINEEAPAGQGEGETKKPAEDSVDAETTSDVSDAHLRTSTFKWCRCPVFEWCDGHTAINPVKDGIHYASLPAGVSSDGSERTVVISLQQRTDVYDEPDSWTVSMPIATEWEFDPSELEGEIDTAIENLQRAREAVLEFARRNGLRETA